MVFCSSTIPLEELKKTVLQSYPGIEQRLRSVFVQHDIVGDDRIPYEIVELLLRNFFYECGLEDYIREVTNSEGLMDHNRVAPYLIGSSMEDLSDSNPERMVCCDEMATLAIVWLKVLSDVYKQEDAGVSMMCGTGMCFSSSTVKPETDVVHTVANANSPSELQSQTAEFDASITINDQQYLEHINDSEDEAQLNQKNVENYIHTLVSEASNNRQKGVKCFVYSSEMTPNGGCISAGAALPQRRERTQGRRKPTAGCC
uniref:Uncharacterized protein n=2 Tax=Babesia bovis TaxID=5865 RepID=S6BDT2_BABBO|nr:conserved hypothetical protein [Babesia bovis]BAN64214.1 conserved hypothetical protein [Babesia bovis]